jgi:hypothetical protein
LQQDARDMTDRQVLLVGSVPLADSEAVFRAAGKTFGARLKRVPDGETGDRQGWIGWQRRQFADQPALEEVAAKEREYQYAPPFRLRAGRSASEIRFGDLGYAHMALESYAVFKAVRADGDLPRRCRFQVALPTPWAPVYSNMAYIAQRAAYPAYEAALLREVAEIAAGIPGQDLAVQWDVATELSWLEDVYPTPLADMWKEVPAIIGRLGAAVPNAAELGIHLCYGSAGNQHWKEPESAAIMARLVNAIADATPRRVDWWHIPVPKERDDAAFFKPLRDLRIGPASEFYLGLVHRDGGNARRIAAASPYIKQFGVAAECGLGRYKAEEVPALFAATREAAKA